MTEEIIIDECFNCKKKRDISDNWRTCKLKCSYKYKRRENDYITRLEQENKDLKDNNNHLQVIIDDGRAENKRFREENRELKAYKDVNEDFKKAWDELNKKYTEVLKLAKTNADSNEYCLQELEKENKELKETIKQYCEWLDEERESNDKLQKVYQDDHCDLLNYRSALEEIRKLTVIGVNASQCNCGLRALADDILDKINEVLSNENKELKKSTKF